MFIFATEKISQLIMADVDLICHIFLIHSRLAYSACD